MIEKSKLIVQGIEYQVLKEEEKIIGLKRFNERTKMWVTINFAAELKNADQYLKELLTQEYLNQQQNAVFEQRAI